MCTLCRLVEHSQKLGLQTRVAVLGAPAPTQMFSSPCHIGSALRGRFFVVSARTGSKCAASVMLRLASDPRTDAGAERQLKFPSFRASEPHEPNEPTDELIEYCASKEECASITVASSLEAAAMLWCRPQWLATGARGSIFVKFREVPLHECASDSGIGGSPHSATRHDAGLMPILIAIPAINILSSKPAMICMYAARRLCL